jgi:hypothetical protein
VGSHPRFCELAGSTPESSGGVRGRAGLSALVNAARVPFLLGFFGVLGGLLAFGPIGLFLGPITMALLLTLWLDWTRTETTAGVTT